MNERKVIIAHIFDSHVDVQVSTILIIYIQFVINNTEVAKTPLRLSNVAKLIF